MLVCSRRLPPSVRSTRHTVAERPNFHQSSQLHELQLLQRCRKLDRHDKLSIRSNELREQPRRLGLSIAIRQPISTWTRFHYFRVFPERSEHRTICKFDYNHYRTERLRRDSDSNRRGPIRAELWSHHT